MYYVILILSTRGFPPLLLSSADCNTNRLSGRAILEDIYAITSGLGLFDLRDLGTSENRTVWNTSNRRSRVVHVFTSR